MRYLEIVKESEERTYRVYHGSCYDDIEKFRTDNLRNRTGTPGTLSFTLNIETAKIYGSNIYAADVTGIFGDYLNPNDCEKNFQFRWPKTKAWHEKRNEQNILNRVEEQMRREITLGRYEY